MTPPSSKNDTWQYGTPTTSATDDQRIQEITVLPPPEHLIRFFPIRATPVETLIADTRRRIHRIMRGEDDRLLVIVGPCSIHNPDAAIEYARKLQAVRAKYRDQLEIVMRVYFEKPRTTVGWKGLINDPYLDGSYRIDEGLRIARELLIDINRLGVPAASELLDTISPQYIGDLISWGAIGARTTESQIHRELASGLSCPVGFKNGTDGSVKIAVDAVRAAGAPHHFLAVTKQGQAAIAATTGNRDCHVILRGGRVPNYDAGSVASACADIEAAGLSPRLMIDASHANSGKRPENQPRVVDAIAMQIEAGERRVFGVMVESHLVGGRQDLVDGSAPTYGQSITDGCLGWDDSVRVLERLAQAVRRRRGAIRANNEHVGMSTKPCESASPTLTRQPLPVA